jgi:VanZ family protein
LKLSGTQRKLLQCMWAVTFCCVAIGSLLPSSSPVISALGRIGVNDKLIHFSAYLVLGLLPVVSFASKPKGVLTGLSMILVGALLEWGQSFVPGRQVEFGDMVANNLGVLCGLLAGLPLRG